MWFAYEGGKFIVNTARGRIKDRNMKRERQGRAHRSSIRTTPTRTSPCAAVVTRETEEGADANIDALAKKYLGQDKYPFRQPGEVRVIYEIEPRSVSAMG